jgi:hypothetical protein
MIGFKVKVIIGFFLLILCLQQELAFASNNSLNKISYLTDEIYKKTYQFQFRKVDSIIAANDHVYSKDLAYNLAIVNFYWWKLISGTQNGRYSDLVSKRIETIEKTYSQRKTKLPDEDLFYLISIFAYNARVSLIDNSYFAAISHLSEYYSFLKLSFGIEPRYNSFYLTSGLYYFFVGYGREKMPILRPLLYYYMPGNMKKGISYLKIAENSTDWKINQESKYFLMKINFDIFKDYSQAAKYCNQLLALYPENLLFQLYMFRISMALNQVTIAKNRLNILERTARNNNQLSADEKSFYVTEAKDELDTFNKKKK